jgi:hypothetical protein
VATNIDVPLKLRTDNIGIEKLATRGDIPVSLFMRDIASGTASVDDEKHDDVNNTLAK